MARILKFLCISFSPLPETSTFFFFKKPGGFLVCIFSGGAGGLMTDEDDRYWAEAKRIVATWNYMSSKKTRRGRNESSAKFCELVGFFPQRCFEWFHPGKWRKSCNVTMHVCLTWVGQCKQLVFWRVCDLNWDPSRWWHQILMTTGTTGIIKLPRGVH